jgi:GTP cyclohydrolase I
MSLLAGSRVRKVNMIVEKYYVTPEEVLRLAQDCARRIAETCRNHDMRILYGVPRGGVPAAFAVANALANSQGRNATITDNMYDATEIIDDLIDSGDTYHRYESMSKTPFFALIDKRVQHTGNWIVFPWEGTEGVADKEESVHDNVRRMLQYIGEDAGREGLKETPNRVIKAYEEWFAGYRQDPCALFKSFLDGSEKHQGDEMVILRNVPVYSHCEHHMAPFFGIAHIGYIPQGKILGLSKMARVVDCFARRLQVQERLTAQIADALDQNLSNRGVGVIIEARHLCMESRGVQAVGVTTTTSAMRGNLLLNQATRQEFLALAQNGDR